MGLLFPKEWIGNVLGLAVFYLAACSTVDASEDGVAQPYPGVSYPAMGILSPNRIDHLMIFSEMLVSGEWENIENSESLTCKRLNENISMTKLKDLVVFEDKDLSIVTDLNRSSYDNGSAYFATCNYVGYYENPWLNWGLDKNTRLDWSGTDAFIDNEYTLLLIDYVDAERKYARALFINKKSQFHSNKMMD